MVGIYNDLFLFEIDYRYDKKRDNEHARDLPRIVYGNVGY